MKKQILGGPSDKLGLDLRNSWYCAFRLKKLMRSYMLKVALCSRTILFKSIANKQTFSFNLNIIIEINIKVV